MNLKPLMLAAFFAAALPAAQAADVKMVDGIAATSSIALANFEPHGRQTVPVELTIDATLDLVNMRYAGHVHVSYSTRDTAGNPAGQGESEHINFHPTENGAVGSSYLI